MEEKLNNKTCNDCKLSRPSGKDNWVKCTKKHNDLKLATAPQCDTPYITNGDRIRAMSDEELVMVIWKSLCGFCPHNGEGNYCNKMTAKTCIEVSLEWLKKEVEE